MTTSPIPARLSILEPFVEVGLFDDAEIQLVSAITRLSDADGNEVPSLVSLAAAVTLRGFRSGHVCVDLTTATALFPDEDTTDLPWPDPTEWLEAMRSTPHVVHTTSVAPADDPGPDHDGPSDTRIPIPPLVLEGTRSYLHRHWVEERLIARGILGRSRQAGSLGLPPADLEAALDRFFGPEVVGDRYDWQRQAARTALSRPISFLIGGPGTGKTRTIARMLACLHTISGAANRRVRVAGAAPSGKAAARMGEAIEQAIQSLSDDGLIDDALATRLRDTPTTTIHSLLGANPRTGFRYDRHDPLTHDMIIIDESSMIDLPLMAALFEALPTRCHVVLVGDPDQLASVGAGTVLGDIVQPLTDPEDGPPEPLPSDDGPSGTHPDRDARRPSPGGITILRESRRFGADSSIASIAEAIRTGDADRTIDVLRSDRDDIDWIRPGESKQLSSLMDTVAAAAVATVEAARRDDVDTAVGHMRSIKVLTAIHDHDLGLRDWTSRIEDRLFRQVDRDSVSARWSEWYIGRPVLITRNDRLLRIANGDTGITIERDGTTTVVLDDGGDQRHEIQAARLDDVQTWWAMTIHKSQGSEFDHVIVSLPTRTTRILTRELLYTAVTRARSKVTIVGDEEMITAAVERPISRASGLRDRLWPQLGQL